MKVAYVRTRMGNEMTATSSSFKIILGLHQRRAVSDYEIWQFTDRAAAETPAPAPALKLFRCDHNNFADDLTREVYENGQPDILWVDGRDTPPYIQQTLDLCPASFKLIYSKHPRPWNIENLERYDLCLVDEDWQVAKVKKHFPRVSCFVWDKLVDYETTFYPLTCEKSYDLCYVASLRKGKNHELLFEAISRVKDRTLTCVCVGGDLKGNRESWDRLAPLQQMVADLGLSVHFTGPVSAQEVNRYINLSKIGVMCSIVDAAPRAMLEYMAADVPVLVSSGMLAGARYLGPAAGVVAAPKEFHLGMTTLLDNRKNYSPRAYLLQNYSFEKVIAKCITILRQAGCQV